MHLYGDMLQKPTLLDMSIPGTHDAGTYKLEDPLGMTNVIKFVFQLPQVVAFAQWFSYPEYAIYLNE